MSRLLTTLSKGDFMADWMNPVRDFYYATDPKEIYPNELIFHSYISNGMNFQMRQNFWEEDILRQISSPLILKQIFGPQ